MAHPSKMARDQHAQRSAQVSEIHRARFAHMDNNVDIVNAVGFFGSAAADSDPVAVCALRDVFLPVLVGSLLGFFGRLGVAYSEGCDDLLVVDEPIDKEDADLSKLQVSHPSSMVLWNRSCGVETRVSV